MTSEEIEQAIRDVGVGWSPISNGTKLEAEPTTYCNRSHCAMLALVGTDADITAAELAAAVISEVNGDSQPLIDIMALAHAAREP